MPRVLVSVLLLAAACAGPPPRDGHGALLAARCTRAEQLLEAGHRNQARGLAEVALQQALESADAVVEARARYLLGLIDADRGQLAQAAALLDDTDATPDLWRVRMGLARASLGAADEQAALEQLERVLAETKDWPDIFQRAEARAPAHQMAGAIARSRGEVARARTHVRQAQLELTLVPADAQMPLRAAVALSLGDDLAAQRDFAAAFECHARAASLYGRLGDPRGALGAQRASARDLVGLGRPLDAADQAGRALRTALALDDVDSAQAIAREAIAWLDAGGAAPDDPRRHLFEEALAPRPSGGDGRATRG